MPVPRRIIRQRYQGSHILVVDDEPLNREVAKFQLEIAGLMVDTAEDGAVATALAQKKMLCGYFDGYADAELWTGWMRRGRSAPLTDYRHTPIIAITGNAFVEDKAPLPRGGDE